MSRSDYMTEIRSMVGDTPLLLPSVSVLVRDAQGRVLLGRHVHTGEWGTIGGMIEPGEAPSEAARREALEETGLEVELTRLIAAVGGPRFEVTYPNGDRCMYVSNVYEARAVGGNACEDGEELSELGWFSPDDLPEDLGLFASNLFDEIDTELRHGNQATGRPRAPSALAYQRSLPAKRMGAGLLVVDGRGRVLLVEPTYKPDWEIPGGSVDADESPRECVLRETREELAFEVAPGRLLVIDYQHPEPDRTESMMFVFEGAVVDSVWAEKIRLPPDELRSCRFVAREDVSSLVSPRMARRLAGA